MTQITQEMINDILNDIQGSCNSLDQVIEEVLEEHGYQFPLSTADEMYICGEVDNAHFLCDRCGWWCEAGDYAEDTEDEICSSCGEDE